MLSCRNFIFIDFWSTEPFDMDFPYVEEFFMHNTPNIPDFYRSKV